MTVTEPARAECPTCHRVSDLAVVGRPWPAHRTPGAGLKCPASGVLVVRRSSLAHRCVDCLALPVELTPEQRSAGLGPVPGVNIRPIRPLATSGRPERCFRHRKAHEKALKAARRGRAREKSRGITEDDRATLWAAQGHACACCGRALDVERKAPTLDHDHRRAAEHDHPIEKACRRCARGLLCGTCNRKVIGDGAGHPDSLAGRYVAGDNPAARLGWWDETEDHDSGSAA